MSAAKAIGVGVVVITITPLISRSLDERPSPQGGG